MHNYVTKRSIMPFGKYKGQPMRNVPAAYLLSLYDSTTLQGAFKMYVTDVVNTVRKDIKTINRQLAR